VLRIPLNGSSTNALISAILWKGSLSFQWAKLFSYNLVLPDVVVAVSWTESQDKLAKCHTLFHFGRHTI
ncbi:unnamed protein product, partial [Boreogadus saida]